MVEVGAYGLIRKYVNTTPLTVKSALGSNSGKSKIIQLLEYNSSIRKSSRFGKTGKTWVYNVTTVPSQPVMRLQLTEGLNSLKMLNLFKEHSVPIFRQILLRWYAWHNKMSGNELTDDMFSADVARAWTKAGMRVDSRHTISRYWLEVLSVRANVGVLCRGIWEPRNTMNAGCWGPQVGCEWLILVASSILHLLTRSDSYVRLYSFL